MPPDPVPKTVVLPSSVFEVAAPVAEAPTKGVRAGPQPGDDPVFRARLEEQAVLAMPFWARVAPRMQRSEDRLEAAEMVERLGRLDEPAASLARAQYDLAQRLIANGGLDRGTESALQYLDSTAASVIQGGNPAEVMTPSEAAQPRLR